MNSLIQMKTEYKDDRKNENLYPTEMLASHHKCILTHSYYVDVKRNNKNKKKKRSIQLKIAVIPFQRYSFQSIDFFFISSVFFSFNLFVRNQRKQGKEPMGRNILTDRNI